MHKMRRFFIFIGLVCVMGCQAHVQEKILEQEKDEISALIHTADSLELRKNSARILEFAERLLKEKGDDAARVYFEKGLEGDPWALPQQLTLGEIMARSGQPEALREKAEMVLRVGEDDVVLQRAARLLGRSLPERPIPLDQVKESQDTLVVAAMDSGVSPLVLQELQSALSKRLGIKVTLASLNMTMPAPARTMKSLWVKSIRENILSKARENPKFEAFLQAQGFTLNDIKTRDDVIVTLVSRGLAEQSATALKKFDDEMALAETQKQWEVGDCLVALEPLLRRHIGPRKWALAVTSHDIFGGQANFLFGAASQGSSLGIVSAHRFSAAFTEEKPKRERLTERLLKQSLSTIAYMMGIPRCNTPECVRAFPGSLQEFDQKPTSLCPICRAGFKKAMEKPLPED